MSTREWMDDLERRAAQSTRASDYLTDLAAKRYGIEEPEDSGLLLSTLRMVCAQRDQAEDEAAKWRRNARLWRRRAELSVPVLVGAMALMLILWRVAR